MPGQWLCDGSSSPVHVIPLEDIREHAKLGRCPCGAKLNADGVVVHNSYDGREFLEDAIKLQANQTANN